VDARPEITIRQAVTDRRIVVAFERIIALLEATGTSARLVRSLPHAPHDAELVISQQDDALPSHSPWWSCVYFGMRMLSRSQRLKLMDAFQVPTVPWASPVSCSEYASLFAAWSTEVVIHKVDFSCAMRGVTRRSAADPPASFNAGDVCMKPVAGPDVTYKVDFLGRTILGCHAMVHERDVPRRSFQLPPDVEATLSTAGERLLDFGVGHGTFDLMEDDGELRIIEVNTGDIGITPWTLDHREQYIERYTTAVLAVLARRSRWEPLRAVWSRCREV
jgi:hypothetical protein